MPPPPHSIELGFIFDRIPQLPFGAQVTSSEADARMVARIQKAWAGFAWKGAPALDLDWPATTTAAPRIALLAEPSRVTTQIRDGRCAQLRSMGLVL